MTTQRLHTDDDEVIVFDVRLPQRDRGTALAAIVLADELEAERARHSRTLDALAEERRTLRISRQLVGELAEYALPRIGEPCPALTGPLVRPYIYDALGAEFLTHGTKRWNR